MYDAEVTVADCPSHRVNLEGHAQGGETSGRGLHESSVWQQSAQPNPDRLLLHQPYTGGPAS